MLDDQHANKRNRPNKEQAKQTKNKNKSSIYKNKRCSNWLKERYVPAKHPDHGVVASHGSGKVVLDQGVVRLLVLDLPGTRTPSNLFRIFIKFSWKDALSNHSIRYKTKYYTATTGTETTKTY
eukprot:scpid100168/ scgid32708/ 